MPREPEPDSSTKCVQLLRDIRSALLAAPELLDDGTLASRRVRVSRSRASLSIGIAAARLHALGFRELDRLFRVRDELGEGHAVSPGVVPWLDRLIDESGRIGRS